MATKHFTALTRPVDPSYSTNRAILLILVGVAIFASTVQLIIGTTFLAGILWGIKAGFAVFVSWVVCRELDPDHDYAAFVATGLGGLVLLTSRLPALGLIFWLVLNMRILNRTSGLTTTTFDVVSILGLTGWFVWQGNWVLGLLTALALGLDALLPTGNRQQLWWAVVAVVVTVIGLLRVDTIGVFSLNRLLVAIVMAVTFVPVFLVSQSVKTVGDKTQEPLTPKRVQAAQAWALLVGIMVAGIQGIDGLQAIYPLWAGTIGASLYWLVYRLYSYS